MPPVKSREARDRVRASAVRRLRWAQEQLATAERVRARAVGTATELAADRHAGERSAAVAGMEQWLHWIDHSESIRPEADGDWAHERDAARPLLALPRVRGGRAPQPAARDVPSRA